MKNTESSCSVLMTMNHITGYYFDQDQYAIMVTSGKDSIALSHTSITDIFISVKDGIDGGSHVVIDMGKDEAKCGFFFTEFGEAAEFVEFLLEIITEAE